MSINTTSLSANISDKSTMSGTISNSGTLSGKTIGTGGVSGKMSVGASGNPNAVLYVEQELTDEQIDQARKNIRIIGKDVSGMTFIPYTVDEPNGYAYIYGEPVVAMEGAEIFNCYDGDRDGYGSDANIATGFMSQAMGYRTQALGNYSVANGWWTKSNGQCSVASGLLSIASGHFCHAEGTRTQATTNNAHSEGDSTIASGRQSHSEGNATKASGFCAHSEGSGTEATNYYSHAEGLGTIAGGRNQTTMGKYNVKDTSSLLIVGKGSNNSNRSNAFTVSSAGAGWFASTVTSTGADYAEYFEWEDGNPNGEDRVGMVVTLNGDKIRLANKGDDIVGVVSGTAMVLGDNFEHEWHNKYLTDEYGRIIFDDPVEEFAEYTDYETGEVIRESTGFHVYPKINPNYDPDQEYINRESRKEWDAVGLLGKLYVNDDGSCVVGGYAEVLNEGVVTSSSTRTNMRVMKRISDTIIQVLMK